jgi:hypothetical protein
LPLARFTPLQKARSSFSGSGMQLARRARRLHAAEVEVEHLVVRGFEPCTRAVAQPDRRVRLLRQLREKSRQVVGEREAPARAVQESSDACIDQRVVGEAVEQLERVDRLGVVASHHLHHAVVQEQLDARAVVGRRRTERGEHQERRGQQRTEPIAGAHRRASSCLFEKADPVDLPRRGRPRRTTQPTGDSVHETCLPGRRARAPGIHRPP